ncbi:MAG: SsrA-binding protein SmpB [Candidatus Colwellbacteria bacterium]
MKELAKNRRAFFDYTIIKKIEAGIELLGFETKAAKTGKINLAGSYVRIKDGQAWLVGASISPYQPKNTPPEYDPERDRRLLLTRGEILSVGGKINESGLTVVPLRTYIKGRLVKVEIGLARSKKKWDKREVIRKRESDTEIRRTFKNK